MLLARGKDGELAAALAVLHLDVFALLDLRAESGQLLETWAMKGGGAESQPHSQRDAAAGAVCDWTSLDSGLPPETPSLLHAEPGLSGGPDLR